MYIIRQQFFCRFFFFFYCDGHHRDLHVLTHSFPPRRSSELRDADSVMSGDCLTRLVRRMDRNPRVGLIQVPPVPVLRESLFARSQQFASSVYGPPFASGLAYWLEGDSNYWGHNAIIRVKPFVEHCGLPVLPGREPFGGEIDRKSPRLNSSH